MFLHSSTGQLQCAFLIASNSTTFIVVACASIVIRRDRRAYSRHAIHLQAYLTPSLITSSFARAHLHLYALTSAIMSTPISNYNPSHTESCPHASHLPRLHARKYAHTHVPRQDCRCALMPDRMSILLIVHNYRWSACEKMLTVNISRKWFHAVG